MLTLIDLVGIGIVFFIAGLAQTVVSQIIIEKFFMPDMNDFDAEEFHGPIPEEEEYE